MSFLIGGVVGFLIGIVTTFFILGLCMASGRADDYNEQSYQNLQPEED